VSRVADAVDEIKFDAVHHRPLSDDQPSNVSDEGRSVNLHCGLDPPDVCHYEGTRILCCTVVCLCVLTVILVTC